MCGGSHVMGVISAERVSGFERIIWRVSRGTAFVRHEDIPEELEDPQTVG
jgi:V-type H+-transporting ATPase subunit a